MFQEIRLRCPFDPHVHLRNAVLDLTRPHWDANGSGRYLRMLLEATIRQFAVIGAMPNTRPPLLNWKGVCDYDRLLHAATAMPFETLRIMQITAQTTEEDIRVASICGIFLGKVYPEDGVTYSSDGSALERLDVPFAAMQKYGMFLLVHLERPGLPRVLRESAALKDIERVARDFPYLVIVVEHVSTSEVAQWVASQRKTIGAGIAIQHLWFSDVELRRQGGCLLCAPIIKSADHRKVLRDFAYSGNEHFWLIDDSAPHPFIAKCRFRPPTGVYCGPVTLPAAATLFDEAGALDQLETFVSTNASRFYRVRRNSRIVRLIGRPWRVPMRVGPYQPMLAGRILPYRITEDMAA